MEGTAGMYSRERVICPVWGTASTLVWWEYSVKVEVERGGAKEVTGAEQRS